MRLFKTENFTNILYDEYCIKDDVCLPTYFADFLFRLFFISFNFYFFFYILAYHLRWCRLHNIPVKMADLSLVIDCCNTYMHGVHLFNTCDVLHIALTLNSETNRYNFAYPGPYISPYRATDESCAFHLYFVNFDLMKHMEWNSWADCTCRQKC